MGRVHGDKKCPFTGNVSIRGRILTGVIQKLKMKNTIAIRRDYLHYIKKYNRFEKLIATCLSTFPLASEIHVPEILPPLVSAAHFQRQYVLTYSRSAKLPAPRSNSQSSK